MNQTLWSAAARIAAALFFGLSIPVHASADEFYTFVVKKQEEKARSRWTLSEWLETKDRMRLMDLWLAMNSPSPYEFFVGAVHRMPETRSGVSPSTAVQAAAYASIFGLGFERGVSSDSTTSAEFLLRVLGYHVQGTQLTLQAGLRSRDSERNPYAGFSLSIYLARHFGFDGLFRRQLQPDPSTLMEGGAFIDFNFLRVFMNVGKTAVDSGASSSQTSLGLRFFF
jgi:hypothetical protein